MNYVSDLPWLKINDFLLDIEKIPKENDFCVQVLKRLFRLIPYDQARIYFVNENGKVCDAVLIGVDKWWNDLYLEYYSKIENGRYSIVSTMSDCKRSLSNFFNVDMYDWTVLGHDEFINDYIKPQELKYSLGFGLQNNVNCFYSIYTLDRTKRSGYTQEEIRILNTIQPHLNNLFNNSLIALAPKNGRPFNFEKQLPLTKREAEIAELLYKGITPANISKKLYLTLPTTYKHISNIHTKLNVSNRQELLLKLIDYFR